MMNERMCKKLIFSTFFFITGFCLQYSQAQNLAGYNWLFGNSDRVIIFNKGTNQPQIDSIQFTPFGTGGSAVISDPLTADILFYSDGNNVYDTNHELLPNGAGLEADPAINRAAAVIPFTFMDGRYLLFTNPGSTGSNEIVYSVIDKNLMGNANIGLGEPARGDIAAKNVPSGLTNPSDGMITIEGAADNQHWLITNDRTTFEYKVLEVNDGIPNIGGIQTFDLSTPSVPGFVASSFAYNADSLLLAVAPKDQNRNIILLDFDPTTGALSLNSQILNTGNTDFATEAIYDLEWSGNGSKLYFSRHGTTAGTNGNLYQFALDDSLMSVNPILASPVFRSYGVQRGPDRRIYHLYQLNSTSDIEVGRINQADSLFSADSARFNVFYDSLAFGNQNFAGTQFPAFPAPNFEMFDIVDFVYADTCAESTTKFFPFVTPSPQRYQWDFGDGQSSNAHSPIHIYQAPGTYPVTLNVFSNGVNESVTKNVTITQNDLMVDLGADTIICAGETLLLDAGPGGVSYAWNTLESTQTITIDTTGYYWVNVVSAATGCSTYDQIQVTTYGDDTQKNNQWYFGEMAGIDFNDGATPITDDNLMTSPVAASSISDANGELLFYTNGVSVWNREHELMVNGNDIGGDSTSVQGAMIVPLPGDSTIFYVFTTDPVWGDYSYDVKYAMVDIKKDTARGEVIFKDRPLFTNSTERMTATAVGSTVIWLITHEYGNNVFRAYPITADGIGAPIISAAGSVHKFSEERNGTASMKVDPGGRRIAVALQDEIDNFVELFTFTDSTGMVDDFIQIDIMEPLPSLAYSVEFSSSLQRLYVTANGNNSKLLQYDLDSINAPTAKVDIEATKFELGNSSEAFGTIQTGSDGIIYMAVENSNTLGTINNPNGDDMNASFIETGFDLAGRTSRLGLPNFVQTVVNPPNSPGITYSNTCIGQPTVFTASTTSSIDVVFWTFGDGTSSDSTTVNHTYNEVGVYDVSLNMTNRCGLDTTFFAQVEIFATPPNPDVPLATTLCNGPVTLAAWPRDTTFTYTWSTGDTTRVITVDRRSTIDVFLTNAEGCSSETVQVLVDDTRPVVNLGPDLVVCQDEFVQDFDGQNPGSAYSWFIDGVNNGNTLRTQMIDTSVPGTYVYRLEVEDVFACVGRDSVMINVIESPVFTSSAQDTQGCGTSDGVIELNITSSGSYTYELNGPVIVGATSVNGPTGGPVVVSNALSAGNYQLRVNNTVSGCTTFQALAVGEPAGFTITPTPLPACGNDGDIEIALSSPFSVRYELFDSNGGTARLVNVGNTSNFTIDDLPTDTYSIEVIDNGSGCIQTATNIVLNENPLAAFTVTPQNICGESGDVSIFADSNNPSTVSYAWTGPNSGSINGSNIGETVNVGDGGTYTVISSDSAPNGLCPQTSDFEVTQTDDPMVVITTTGDNCTGQLTLVASVSNGSGGNLGYQWGDGSNSSQLVVTSTGNYEVTVLDQGTGCQGTGNIDVEVFNEITVFIRSEPNCDDNSEVLLTAIANITEDVTFEWTDPFGDILPNTGAVVSARTSGNYSVTVAGVNNNCSATDDIDVLIIPITDDQLLLATREDFCSADPDPANNVIILDPGQFSSYEWRILNEDPILGTERLFTVMDAGVYEVTLSNGLTCIRDIVEIIDDCDPLIFAPNAFTPDSSSGLNDFFTVFPNPYVTDFEIFIFSRQGELVFQSNKLDFQWDGTYRGSLLQVGTYAYVMRYKSTLDLEGRIIEQHGGVMLLR